MKRKILSAVISHLVHHPGYPGFNYDQRTGLGVNLFGNACPRLPTHRLVGLIGNIYKDAAGKLS